MSYNLKKGKEKIEKIIDAENCLKVVETIPSVSKLTPYNGYYGWVTSIFVDIRNSTELFSKNGAESTARIVRCFASEVIEILKNSSTMREIGIRGDCVYAVYAIKKGQPNLDVFGKALDICSFIELLTKVLKKRNMTTIKIGIGIASYRDLVVLAGNESNKFYEKVWVGKAVTYASKLSNMANKDGKSQILVTAEFYNKIISFFDEKKILISHRLQIIF